ncbi:MAG: PAS domain S-box protein, partial [Proteobacteria bacterium]|nr:PAS domain S-box protein [Pseudomonadota bacterium]
DLLAEVQAGRFREDLYSRLNVIAVTAPPHRARREDNPLHGDNFVGLYAKKNAKPRLTVARAALERMLGYSAEEMVGWPAADFTHPDDATRSAAALDALVAGEQETLEAQQRYLHRDGHTVWTHAHLALMRDASGAPQYLLLQLRDVSEQNPAEAELRPSSASREHPLDASNRQLQMFVDAVSHDLRAPLRAIESFSERLAERCHDQLDQTGRDHLDRIRAAAARMSSLLAALSELSYATRAELKPEAVDISLLAEWAIAELREAEPERAADIAVQPGIVGHGDERLLKLLLGHLLSNAWKFSRDCEQAWIRVSGDTDDSGTLRLRVVDAGSGFDMRYAHKLFEPFQRLHGPDQGGGHGLGLAIARRIAERHGGDIRAESVPGSGSTFHLQLPAAPAADV